MILLIVGTQKFQFNRLLMTIDKLIDEKKITERVVAQVGNSDYKPVNYEFQDFFDSNKFDLLMDEATLIITHGGVGSIVSALKKDKKVIVVPRLKKYNEHIDDHQLEIVEELKKRKHILLNTNLNDLYSDLCNIEYFKPNLYKKDSNRMLYEIDKFISEIN